MAFLHWQPRQRGGIILFSQRPFHRLRLMKCGRLVQRISNKSSLLCLSDESNRRHHDTVTSVTVVSSLCQTPTKTQVFQQTPKIESCVTHGGGGVIHFLDKNTAAHVAPVTDSRILGSELQLSPRMTQFIFARPEDGRSFVRQNSTSPLVPAPQLTRWL